MSSVPLMGFPPLREIASPVPLMGFFPLKTVPLVRFLPLETTPLWGFFSLGVSPLVDVISPTRRVVSVRSTDGIFPTRRR